MRRRRAVLVFLASTALLVVLGLSLPAAIEQTFFNNSKQALTSPSATLPSETTPSPSPKMSEEPDLSTVMANQVLEKLAVKGRAPKTGYSRSEFGDGWATTQGCDTRNIILHRDLTDVTLQDSCKVVSGSLNDPYTGQVIKFVKTDSSRVQIDHVVALSDAWQKGAQQLTKAQRIQLANDPMELLAVDGPSNQAKGDSDAASWLPKNKLFRCQYVARQIAVKQKYSLWITAAEKSAIGGILKSCPKETLPAE